ncbi:MAG: ArsR family transcriptional regulator [Candidatus Bathyarchaeia archaeon]|jgi:predicted transcriptional regulator
MTELNDLAKTLDALGHPLRLKIVALLAGGEMYLNEIANELCVNRALAKVHLKKLERAGIVKSRIELAPGEAKALRYYKLQQFEIHVSPQILRKEVENSGC